jgi:Na+-transporting methylmalonyl-CoA/oxaloacetate decarboxylase gamma subunit
MEPTLQNALIISLVGIFTTLLVLTILAVIIHLMNKVDYVFSGGMNTVQKIKNYRKTLTRPAIQLPTTAPALTESEIVVITAAVTSIFGDKVRVGRVSFLAADQQCNA